MAEMRIGVANGGAVMNGVSGMGTGVTGQAAAPPINPASALVGAIEAGMPPQTPATALAPVAPAPAQAAWQAPAPAPAVVASAAPVSIGAMSQVAPYTPPSTAVPPTTQAPLAASNAILTPSDTDQNKSTTLSSSSAAAIAVPLVVVACAIFALAGLIWWYKRHPPRNSGSFGRRQGHRERDEMSISEKALILIPGYDHPHSRCGSVRSVSSTAIGSVRGVTVIPHVDVPAIARPAPSVTPSIASVRRPTSMNISKPLPPISEYGGSSSSGSSARTRSTVPVIHSATVGRRADAQFVNSHTPPSHSTYPTIVEGDDGENDGNVTTAPNSPRTRLRSAQQHNYFATSRMTSSNPGVSTSRRSGLPAASIYSTHSAPLPRSKRSGPSRRPIPVDAYSYTHSLPASIARSAPVSTVRKSPVAHPPSLGHSPQSSCESESLPETVDFPPDHPFARKYTGSSTSSSSSLRPRDAPSYENDDAESMMRSITAGTEMTLPWGFAEAGKAKKYEDGVEPLRKPAKETGVKLFREETRKGVDWARERSY